MTDEQIDLHALRMIRAVARSDWQAAGEILATLEQFDSEDTVIRFAIVASQAYRDQPDWEARIDAQIARFADAAWIADVESGRSP